MALNKGKMVLGIDVDIKNGDKFSKLTNDSIKQEKALKSLNKQIKTYISELKKLNTLKFPKVGGLSTPSSTSSNSSTKSNVSELNKSLKIERDILKAKGESLNALKKSQEIIRNTYGMQKVDVEKIYALKEAQEIQINRLKTNNELKLQKISELNIQKRENAKLREIRLAKKLAKQAGDTYEYEKQRINEIVALKKKAGESDSSIDKFAYKEDLNNKFKNDLSSSLINVTSINKYKNIIEDIKQNLKKTIIANTALNKSYRVSAMLVRKTYSSIKLLRKGIKTLLSPLKIATGLLKKMALIGASFYVAKAFIGSMIKKLGDFFSIGAMFEDTNKKITALTGSSKEAGVAMNFLREYSRKAAIDVTQAGTTLAKMSAYGLGSVKENIKYYKIFADTAAATGKTADQVSEAVVDAMQGENERMKELAIRGRVAGDQIVYTYKAISGEMKKIAVDNNPDKILSVLTTVMKDKYKGQLEAMSGTWNGLLARIKNTFVLLGEKILNSKNLFEDTKKSLAGFLDTLDRLLDSNDNTLFDSISDKIRGFIEMLKSSFIGLMKFVIEIKKTVSNIKGSFGGKLFGLDGATLEQKKLTEEHKKYLAQLEVERGIWEAKKASYSWFDISSDGRLEAEKKIIEVNQKIRESEINYRKEYIGDVEESYKKELEFAENLFGDVKSEAQIAYDSLKTGIFSVETEFSKSMDAMAEKARKTAQQISSNSFNVKVNVKTSELSATEISKRIKEDQREISSILKASGGNVTKENEEMLNALRNDRDALKMANREQLAFSVAKVKQQTVFNLKKQEELIYENELSGIFNRQSIIQEANLAREKEILKAKKAGRTEEDATRLGQLRYNKIITEKSKLLENANKKEEKSLEKQEKSVESRHKKEMEAIRKKISANISYYTQMSGLDKDYWDKSVAQRENANKAFELGLELEKQRLQETGLEISKINEMLKEKGRIYYDNIAKMENTFANGIREYTEDLNKRLTDSKGLMTTLLNGLESSINKGFDNLFDGFIDGTMSAKDAFKSMAKDMLTQLLRLSTQMAAMNLMKAIMPSGGGSGGIGGWIASAFGFSEGGLVPQRLATGGTFYGSGSVPGYDRYDSDKVNAKLTGGEYVINRGSVDKYGKGLLGAINNGNFSGNTSPIIKVNNFTGQEVKTRTNSKGETELTIGQIKQITSHLEGSMSSGTGSFAHTLQSSFNVQRR